MDYPTTEAARPPCQPFTIENPEAEYDESQLRTLAEFLMDALPKFKSKAGRTSERQP